MGDSIDKLFNQLTKNIEFTTDYHNQNALKAQITPDCDENCVMQSQIASAKASDEYIKQQFAKRYGAYKTGSGGWKNIQIIYDEDEEEENYDE